MHDKLAKILYYLLCPHNLPYLNYVTVIQFPKVKKNYTGFRLREIPLLGHTCGD